MRKRDLAQTGGILALFLCIMFLCASAAEVEVLEVSPLSKRTIIFNAVEGDIIRGSLAITEGRPHDIDFWITDPHGNTIVNLGRVRYDVIFEFTAQSSGAFTFHFDNSFSSLSSKTITLSYSKSRPGTREYISVLIGVLFIIMVIIGLIAFLDLHGSKYTSKQKRATLKKRGNMSALRSPSIGRKYEKIYGLSRSNFNL